MDAARHLAMYAQSTGNTRYGDSLLPDWVHRQKLQYPHHKKHSELIDRYRDAAQKHAQTIKTLQFVFRQPGDTQTSESIKRCQEQEKEAKLALELAATELENFNNHEPEERIALYEGEIARLKPILKQAKASEASYVQELLTDPDIQRQRLEREVRGEGGLEYSREQIQQLQLFRGAVRAIENEIRFCQQDIQRIQELASEREQQKLVQVIMDKVLPEFADACINFSDALAKLQHIAAEYGIRVLSQDIRVPERATFQPNKQGSPSVYFEWS